MFPPVTAPADAEALWLVLWKRYNSIIPALESCVRYMKNLRSESPDGG